MATLVKNVWIDGRYYGPDHGGDGELPAHLVDRVPVDAWDQPPGAVSEPGPPPVAAPPYAEAARTDYLAAMSKPELLAEADRRGVNVAVRWPVDRIREALR